MKENMLATPRAFALPGTTLIAAPASAQADQPAGSTTAPPAASPTGPASEPTMGNRMTEEQPGQWQASKLRGLTVYKPEQREDRRQQ